MEIVIKVNSTYNNTIVSALYKGKILKTISTGSLGFKKAKRSSTLAAQTCGEALGSWLMLLSKNLVRPSPGFSIQGVDFVPSFAQPWIFDHGRGQESTQKGLSFGTKLDADLRSHAQRAAKDGSFGGDTLLSNDRHYSLLLDAKKKLGSIKGSSNISLSQTLWNNRVSSVEGSQTERSSYNRSGPHKKEVLKLDVFLLIAGVGYGKFGVIRGLSKLGVKIKTISDVTSIPHNGCKPPKMRRK